MDKNQLSLLEVTHYSDAEVLDNVKMFHSRGLFTSLTETAERTYVSAVPPESLKRFENKEILLQPGLSRLLKVNERDRIFTERKPSGIHFIDERKISFDDVTRLLINAFSSGDPDSVRRPYPSGGAQYPVEVFMCRLTENTDGWPADINAFHYLPVSRSLESAGAPALNDLYRALAGGDQERLGRPHFALVYFIVFEKALFKYRYRGYRMAMMEAGSMYQNAGMVADRLGLSNRVWAAFTDTYVSKMLNVDMRTAAPLIVQFFGDYNP
ncbi:SagB/ThcOx family dehydrogenase [Sodalis sp. RH15]|uniref:SagB/ThcOx family dehydrogenase n=1 Tax=Sodalis sp. RH15 TaxID=3394330 RepID=UPI0039B4E32A